MKKIVPYRIRNNNEYQAWIQSCDYQNSTAALHDIFDEYGIQIKDSNKLFAEIVNELYWIKRGEEALHNDSRITLLRFAELIYSGNISKVRIEVPHKKIGSAPFKLENINLGGFIEFLKIGLAYKIYTYESDIYKESLFLSEDEIKQRKKEGKLKSDEDIVEDIKYELHIHDIHPSSYSKMYKWGRYVTPIYDLIQTYAVSKLSESKIAKAAYAILVTIGVLNKTDTNKSIPRLVKKYTETYENIELEKEQALNQMDIPIRQEPSEEELEELIRIYLKMQEEEDK